jgi:putative Mg2+ transporter-C (MgtC) family protein
MTELTMFQSADLAHALSVAVRLTLAAALGAILGYERERGNKTAGLRTHMLVSLGSAVFVMASLEAGATPADLTRVVQGIATGIGFVGAGAILKTTEQGHVQVKGLTTASTVWLTAGAGLAVGAGRLWLPLFATILGLGILVGLHRYEDLIHRHEHEPAPPLHP